VRLGYLDPIHLEALAQMTDSTDEFPSETRLIALRMEQDTAHIETAQALCTCRCPSSPYRASTMRCESRDKATQKAVPILDN
jgi:hypothetical protein